MPKIVVHEKALGHLSRGLYRSPASALRELVSNAWDAGASKVVITTNYPKFFQIAIQDDGVGFTQAEFVRLMGGGIGNSEKRLNAQRSNKNRPTIGRLGIGLLGIAQICPSFKIVSKTAKDGGFAAEVRLYDLLKKRLDETTKLQEIDVGEYRFFEEDLSKRPIGTTVYSSDVHPTFSKSFQDSVNREGFAVPPRSWLGCIDECAKVRSLNELGDYWKLIWELAAATPVPYVSPDAVPKGAARKDHERLVDYDFSVVVDGIPLAKPIFLKGNEAGYTIHKIKPISQRIYGNNLTYHGYIAVQEGKQLKPDELRGLLIRVKNIGIGYYDPSMLDYRINEGPRSRWVTGEIYIDDGLEDALNIDRDSFNRFHPEFRAVQQHIHQILQKDVFPKVYKKIEVRSTAKADVKSTKRAHMANLVIARAAEESPSLSRRAIPVLPTDRRRLHKQSSGTSNYLPKGVSTKRSQAQLADAIMALFDTAAHERDAAKRRQLFGELLAQLLAKW